MSDHRVHGFTPTGHQRSPGGGLRWQPPSTEHLSKLLPQYEVECLLGRGGMGAVYKGRQKSLNRPVAIKILPPEVEAEDVSYLERFKNEAQVMAKFIHPGIVAVHDFGETDEGQLYIVMEFVDGTDVAQMIAAQGRLPPEHALAIAAHVCDALSYAHSHGVIHRDIKPANILINREGTVKVADFGLAKIDEPGTSGLTKTSMAMGTPDYVAPEVLVMGTQPDARADLYAIGVMLYHMLTGDVPRGSFDLPSKRFGSDPRFDAIILKAMKMDREKRYQSAAILRADLQAIISTPQVIPVQASQNDMPEQVPAESEPMSAPRRGLPRVWLIGAGVALVLLIAAGVLLMNRVEYVDSVADAANPAAAPAGTDHAAPPPAQEEGGIALDPTKWLPFTYPGDFGKIDGGVEALEDGGVTVEGSFGKRLRATWTHQDLAVRARITLPAEGTGILGLRTDLNKAAVRAVVRPDRIEIVSEVREDADTADQTILSSFTGVSGPFYEKKGAELAFAVLGNEYRLWLGAKLLGSVTDTTTIGGKVLFDGVNATFHDMQWQVIGDTSAPVTPQPPALKTEDITGVWPRPGNSSQCVLYPDGKITLINQYGQEDGRADGTPYWTGWRWRIEADKALLSTADGKLQEEWTLTQPGLVSIKHISKGSLSTSRRSSAVIPTIRPTPPPVIASKPVPATPPPSQIPNLKSQMPGELKALQADYAASIASRVTAPHDSSLAQLNTGFTAALDRAVASRQLPAAAILADKQAIADQKPLPPDTDTTPDVLKTYRATYRAKASEIDDTHTTAHLGLLTPFVAKLRELEATLTQAGRTADAAAVKAYRDALSENPLALPETKP